MDHNPQPPHCLILPYPIQGHINPLLQFSKRLSHKGISITITVPKRLRHISDTIPQVETISDGYDDGVSADVDPRMYLAKFQRVGPESLTQLLDKLRESGRAVDCIVYDPFLPWAVDVAKNHGLIAAAFFTQSCGVNAVYYQVFRGEIGIPIMEEEIRVPGLVKLGVMDLPTFVLDQKSHPEGLKLLLDQYWQIEDADFVLVNSIYEMEKEVTDWMSKLLPVKTIGPTVPSMYLDNRISEDTDYGLSIFNPVNTCMKWLEGHSSKSVIYVSFGSMARFHEDQMEELALGIKMTKKPFLWVVRSSEESKLPKTFQQETSIDHGLIVSWCPQLEVLVHDAIGCFVTHCGWNSTLEAVSLGVPMVGVPWWSDQTTNAKFVMDVWKLGIRARPDEKNVVRRSEIARCVEYVMDGERGEEMRENARKWKEVARKAIDEGGSSDANIEEFVSTLVASMPSLN